MVVAADAAVEQQSITKEIGTAVKHSLVYGLGGVLSKAIGFLMLPLYTHYLTPKEYGILEMLDLTMSLLGMFLNMGITAAFLKQYGAAQSEADRCRIVSTVFFFALATGLVVLAVGFLLVPRVTLLLFGPGVPPIYLFLSLAFFVMGYVGIVPYTYARAKEHSGRLVTLDTITTLLLLVINLYLLVSLKLSIMAVLVGPLICSALKLVVLFKWMTPAFRMIIDWKQLSQMLRFGAPLVFSNLTMYTLNFSDRFFLQRFQSLDMVGVYSVGYKFGFLLNFLLIQQFNMMWQARMYIVYRSPDHRRIFNQLFVLYSLVLIFAALGLALFGPQLMAVMVDQRYAAGSRVIPVVALAYVVLGVGFYLQLGMFLAAKTKWIAVVSTCSAVLNLVLNYTLVQYSGMMGAAWATVFGFLALAVGSYYFSERACPLGLKVGQALKALGLAIGIYILSEQFVLPSLALALLVKIAWLTGFAALVWMVGAISRDELATLGSLRELVVERTTRLVNRP